VRPTRNPEATPVPFSGGAAFAKSSIVDQRLVARQPGRRQVQRPPSRNTSGELRVGCSGWQYKHWRGAFYPSDLPQSGWLGYYASRFDTVEINNTFYRLPEAAAFTAWEHGVPPGFVYAVKASRFLTHMKKLKDPEEPLDRLFSRAKELGRALGPVLYQLPPNWRMDLERLEVFVRALPKRRRHAIEFRDPTWYTSDVFALLARYGVALCVHDMAGSATGQIAVGPFVYARFHGPRKYSGRYDDRTLDAWANWLSDQLHEGKPVYAYFNNDTNAEAPRDAVRLRDRIGAQALARDAPSAGMRTSRSAVTR
jgi:uncharacterized protein YecE (DUF72 family)